MWTISHVLLPCSRIAHWIRRRRRRSQRKSALLDSFSVRRRAIPDARRISAQIRPDDLGAHD